MFTPLDQFSPHIVIPFLLFSVDFSLTLGSLFLIGTFILELILFINATNPTLYPTPGQYFTESLSNFIFDTIRQQAGPMGLKYAPFLYTCFVVVLSSNLIGLLPFAFTPTSQLVLTFSLALSCNFALILIGFYENGFKFFALFKPEAPIILVPLIFAIEFVSYLLRTFSLSIRLFANMMAGHTLLHILSSFVIAFVKARL
jgi:F-type H+-transporting ATPase subunit a